MPDNNFEAEIEDKKELYGYQQGDIDAIFSRMEQVAPKLRGLEPVREPHAATA